MCCYRFRHILSLLSERRRAAVVRWGWHPYGAQSAGSLWQQGKVGCGVEVTWKVQAWVGVVGLRGIWVISFSAFIVRNEWCSWMTEHSYTWEQSVGWAKRFLGLSPTFTNTLSVFRAPVLTQEFICHFRCEARSSGPCPLSPFLSAQSHLPTSLTLPWARSNVFLGHQFWNLMAFECVEVLRYRRKYRGGIRQAWCRSRLCRWLSGAHCSGSLSHWWS